MTHGGIFGKRLSSSTSFVTTKISDCNKRPRAIVLGKEKGYCLFYYVDTVLYTNKSMLCIASHTFHSIKYVT